MTTRRHPSALNWSALGVIATLLLAMAGWVLTNSNDAAVTKSEVADQGQELKDVQKTLTRLEIDSAQEKCNGHN